MIKGIIFDMVGPLLQKNPVYVFDEVIETAEKIKNNFPNDKEFIKALGENEVTKRYSLEEIAQKVVSKYCKISEIWNILLPKLKENYKLGIINNGTAITIPYFKKENNFDEFFSIFINSSEVNIEKPDSRIYLLALEQMNLKPEECVFIDDMMDNVLGAEKIGMKGLLFTNYTKLITDLISFNIDIKFDILKP
jgi:HAD superfamily hydrolase (TIGR01549 family)